MNGIHPLQTTFWLACDAIIWRHCAPWELDEALVEWGYRLGPCEAQDLAGLGNVLEARGAHAASPVLSRMVAEGRLGKSAGWGYYRYPGGGGAVIDPLIEDLVREEAWFAGIERAEKTGATLVACLHELVRSDLETAGSSAAELIHLPADLLELI